MFDESPYHAGGAFRSQGEFSTAPILEDIHFFLDHVGTFTEGPLKKIDGFKGGRANFPVAEAGKELSRGRFQALEFAGVVGKNIFGAANRLEFRHV